MIFSWLLVTILISQTPPANADKGADDAKEQVALQRLLEAAQRSESQDSEGAEADENAENDADLSGLEATEIQLSGNEVNVEVVGTDKLILTGTDEDLDTLMAFIETLDRAVPRPGFRLYRLQNAAADNVAPIIQKIVESTAPPTARPEDKVTITAEPRTNLLIISAPEARMDEVIEIVELLDAQEQKHLPELQTEIFTLKYVQAAEAASTVMEQLDKLEQMRGAEGATQVEITPNPRNNTLTVMTPPENLETIRKILNQIDIEPTYGTVKLLLLKLINADANELAELLTSMIEQEAQQAGDLTEQIRRLRLVKQTEGGELEELPELNLEKPLIIYADKNTNALMIGTIDENIPAITEIVKLLDSVALAPEMGIRIFPLKYADAENLMKMLREMFDEGKKLPYRVGDQKTTAVPEGVVGKAMVYNIGIAVDVRTNTLVVSGRPEQIAMAQTIVAEMDNPETEIRFPPKLIFLEHADARQVSDVIEKLHQQYLDSLKNRQVGIAVTERERLFVTAEIRSNAIILACNEDNFNEYEALALRLDESAQPLIGEIHIINCINTSAADLATKIEDLWERKAQMRREGDVPEDLPVIIPDSRSNSLVIAAKKDDYEHVKDLVDRLEAQPLSPVAMIRLMTLKYNDAGEIANMFQDLFEKRAEQRLTEGQELNPSDRVAVAADAATNTLLVASSKENFDEMMRVLEVIDGEPDVEGIVRIFYLDNADATITSEQIKELFEQGIYKPNAGLGGKITEEREKVALIADVRANAIIASASKPNLSIIEMLIEQMDAVDAPRLMADTKLFRLTFSDAIKLAAMLDKLFEGIQQNAPDQNVMPKPTILADDRSNTLIISGTRDSLVRAENLISELDRDAGLPTANFEVYPLEFGSAIKLAPKMQDLFEKRAPKGQEIEGAPIQITAEEGSNALIVSASLEDHSIVKSLLALLDKPSSLAFQFEMFPLQKARAEQVADLLDEMFKQQGRTDQGGGVGRADAIAVRPDIRTNSLIVWAAPGDMANIAKILERLDQAEPTQEHMIRVIRLYHADAEQLAETLQDTLATDEPGRQADRDSPATIISFLEELPDGTKQVRKLLRQDITIAPDVRTNSLLVMAPPQSMDLLESLIVQIDQLSPMQLAVRIFPLENADAEETVETLKELFETEERGEGEKETEITLEGGAIAPAAGGEGGSGLQELRLTADSRTNSVIAVGSEDYLALAEDLIYQLDRQDAEDRITLVYEVKNGTAESIGGAIESFVEAERDRYSQIEDQTALARLLEREVTVVPDEESNSIILGMSPRYQSQYMEMIRKLDSPPPQVMIQVLLAEVSLDSRLELGLEFGVQDLLFTENAQSGPNGTIQGHGFDFVAGVDLGAAGSGTGFTFTITGEDFSFLLHALQSEGRLEILSRPIIMCQNNQEANITIGQEVPFLRSVNISDSGQTNSNVDYEDIGIILDVTPHINPDGYVNLEIAPEISSIGDSSIQISEGITAPTFLKRSASTTVTVKHGETVVLGGLIRTDDSQRETTLPIIGDIPILNNLFRSTSHTSLKTELLIVLTVNVIRSEFDAYEMSVEERDKIDLLPDDVKRSPLLEKLQYRPEDELWSAPGEEPLDTLSIERDYFGPAPSTYDLPRPQPQPDGYAPPRPGN